jgi:hypothetical protein
MTLADIAVQIGLALPLLGLFLVPPRTRGRHA